MPNTYTQLFVHIVFTVRGRENLIPAKHRENIHKYITGIVTKRKQKLLSIFAMPDHVHVFVGLTGDIAVSDLVRDIKAGSSKYITDNNLVKGKFNWQTGYGAFSYSKSQIDKVNHYILNQEQHHKKRSFKEEYIEFLDKFGVDYDKKYLFKWIELPLEK